MSKYGSAIVRLAFLAVLVAAIGFFASPPVHAQTLCTTQCEITAAECESSCQGNGPCIQGCRAVELICIECCEDPNCNGN
jgi:hypothetical protein